MKRFNARKLVPFIALLLIPALSACEGSAVAEGPTVYDMSYYSNAISYEDYTQDTEEYAQAENLTAEVNGFSLEVRGAVVYMNQNMADVKSQLGEPLGVHETPSCAFEGFDRIFQFPGLQIHTYPLGDKDMVQIISLRDDSVRTTEGIFLGSNWSDVLDAYGTNYEHEFNMFTFTRGQTTLSFFVSDSMVVDITYSLIMD